MAGFLGIEASDEKPFIFISYNTEDQERLCNIIKMLQKHPINIWYDNGIKRISEEGWQKQIALHIRDAEIIFFFISHGIFKKENSYVRKEYNLAARHRKNICVVLLDEIDARNIPAEYDFWWDEVVHKQCIDAVKMTYEQIAEAIYAECYKIGAAKDAKEDIEDIYDPEIGDKVPTFYQSFLGCFMDDEDFESIMENADVVAGGICGERTKQIETIRKMIMEVSAKEQPFDIFICYKETDENSYRTLDSAIANDIYYQLRSEGFKVFYAAVSLAGKPISEYESYIFFALKTSKVMLVLGTKPEYFNYIGVKNEWSGFLKIMKKDSSRRLFPCYRDMNPDELPEKFADMQAQDMSRIDFLVDIVREIRKGIVKVAPQTSLKDTAEKKQAVVSETIAAAQIKSGKMALENYEWNKADRFFEKALNLDPECVEAYLGKLMAELHVRKLSNLSSCKKWFTNNISYQKALCFADAELKDALEKYAVTNVAYLPPTPCDAFRFSLKKNGCLVEGLCDEKYREIRIPENYQGKPVNAIRCRAFCGCKSLTSVAIPDSVTSIEAYAFFGCESLTSIIIPDSVTYIGDKAFYGCKNLTSIRIPDSVTFIEDSTFWKCESLTSVRIPDSVTTIGAHAFFGCESLTSVTIPDSVKAIGDKAFSKCKSLTSVMIPESVTSIGDNVF